jgi:hypothetical protein
MDEVAWHLKRGTLEEHVVSLSAALEFLPAVGVDMISAKHIRQGQSVALPHADERLKNLQDNALVRIGLSDGDVLVAVGEVRKQQGRPMVKAKRVFHHGAFTRERPCDRDGQISKEHKGRNVDGVGHRKETRKNRGIQVA